MTKEERQAYYKVYGKAYRERKKQTPEYLAQIAAWEQYKADLAATRPARKERRRVRTNGRNSRRLKELHDLYAQYDTLPPEQQRDLLIRKLKGIWHNSKGSADRRGLAFNIPSYVELLELYDRQGGKCALTGWDLTLQKGSPRIISLDRIDNAGPYTLDNIQLLTWHANVAKNEWTEPDLLALAEAIIKHNKPL